LKTVRPTFDGDGRILEDTILASMKCDQEGRYTFWTVREDPKSPTIDVPGRDYEHFAIGAFGGTYGRLIKNVTVGPESVAEVNVTMGGK